MVNNNIVDLNKNNNTVDTVNNGNSANNINNSNNVNEIKIAKKFEFFDVTADIGFTAYGLSLTEGFQNAANALFEVITDTNLVNVEVLKDIEIKSEDLISLLYDFLEELLFLHETEFLLFSEFNVKDIKQITENNEDFFILNATVGGEAIDWNKHQQKAEVKAITFHQMNVFKNNNVWNLKAILDL
jgi:SHS2 domain-containing protein